MTVVRRQALSLATTATLLDRQRLRNHRLALSADIGWGDLNGDFLTAAIVVLCQLQGSGVGDGLIVNAPTNRIIDAIALGVCSIRPGDHRCRRFLKDDVVHHGRLIFYAGWRRFGGFPTLKGEQISYTNANDQQAS